MGRKPEAGATTRSRSAVVQEPCTARGARTIRPSRVLSASTRRGECASAKLLANKRKLTHVRASGATSVGEAGWSIPATVRTTNSGSTTRRYGLRRHRWRFLFRKMAQPVFHLGSKGQLTSQTHGAANVRQLAMLIAPSQYHAEEG